MQIICTVSVRSKVPSILKAMQNISGIKGAQPNEVGEGDIFVQLTEEAVLFTVLQAIRELDGIDEAWKDSE